MTKSVLQIGWLGLNLTTGWALAGASSLVVPVQEDTWIDGLGSTRVLGADERLGICPAAYYWIYLKFNLQGISGQVTEAELRLKRIDGSRPEEISVYLINDDSWTESSLTGPTRPAPANPSPTTTLATGGAGAGYDRWNSETLTATVRQELTGDRVLSLMLREDPGAAIDVRHYFSREAPRPDSDKPQLVLTLTPAETVAPGWVVAEVGAGTKPSFDFDAAGRIHVMGMTEDPDGEVWYAAAPYSEGPWKPASVAKGHFYGPGDLRVDQAGTVHVAWHNHDLENPDHLAIHTDGRRRRFNIDTPGLHDGWDNSLFVDGSGLLHQACVYPVAFGAQDSLQYGVFDGAGWDFQSRVTNSGPFMYGLNTTVAVDRQGNLHVAYCQTEGWTTPGRLQYAVRTDAGWTVSTVVSNGVPGRFPSIALDHWDRPHLAWLDLDPADPSHGTVRYGLFNSGQWTIEDVDQLTNIEMGFLGARKSVSLALDSSYRPHLAYSDRRRIVYAVKPFDLWQTTNVLEHAEPTYNGLVVLRLNPEGRPGIVFWQPAQDGSGLVRFLGLRELAIHLFPPAVDPVSGAVALQWTSGPEGTGYSVESRGGFLGGQWTPLSGPELLAVPRWTDTLGGASSRRFYRVRAASLGAADGEP